MTDEAYERATHAMLEEINTLNGVEVLTVNHNVRSLAEGTNGLVVFPHEENGRTVLVLRLERLRGQVLQEFGAATLMNKDDPLVLQMFAQEQERWSPRKEMVSPGHTRVFLTFRQERAHELFTALLEHFRETEGARPTGAQQVVDIQGALVGFDPNANTLVTLYLPGFEDQVIVPCFSTMGKYESFWKRFLEGDVPHPRVITDREAFVAGVLENKARLVYDITYTPDGKVRFLEMPLGKGGAFH